jgi:hypothetical protein
MTIYDDLFLYYRMEVTVHKPHKNRLSLPPRVVRTVSGAVCRYPEGGAGGIAAQKHASCLACAIGQSCGLAG